jgi:2-C-methyl-D-erythritol 4-phosphate cytidylyltransferase
MCRLYAYKKLKERHDSGLMIDWNTTNFRPLMIMNGGEVSVARCSCFNINTVARAILIHRQQALRATVPSAME